MDIGTAKPPLEVRLEIPHHLIDIVDPWESYSVGRYVQDAQGVIKDLSTSGGCGKEHIVVGGTALYIKALTEGLFQGPEADWAIRQELEGMAAKRGVSYLHSLLEEVDPIAAKRIETGDLRRVVRALEVYRKTGRPISSWQKEWVEFKTEADLAPESHSQDIKIVVLSMDRKELYRRIEERVEGMFQQGLVEEVQRLREHPLGLGRQAREALGYAEVLEYLEGRLSLPEAKELIKRNSRRFAKRQLTWFRSFKGAKWLEVTGGAEETAKRVQEVFYS